MPITPASNYPDLYKMKKSFENALKAYLEASPRSIANVYRSRANTELITPRVEIMFNLGQEMNHKRLVLGRMVPDLWTYGCTVRVVTSRLSESEGGKDHDDLVSELLAYLQAYGHPFNNTNMPYWQVAIFSFAGSSEGAIEGHEEDATDLQFAGTIGIEPGAWVPVVP